MRRQKPAASRRGEHAGQAAGEHERQDGRGERVARGAGGDDVLDRAPARGVGEHLGDRGRGGGGDEHLVARRARRRSRGRRSPRGRRPRWRSGGPRTGSRGGARCLRADDADGELARPTRALGQAKSVRTRARRSTGRSGSPREGRVGGSCSCSDSVLAVSALRSSVDSPWPRLPELSSAQRSESRRGVSGSAPSGRVDGDRRDAVVGRVEDEQAVRAAVGFAEIDGGPAVDPGRRGDVVAALPGEERDDRVRADEVGLGGIVITASSRSSSSSASMSARSHAST